VLDLVEGELGRVEALAQLGDQGREALLLGRVAAEVVVHVLPLPIDALDERLGAAGVDALASQLAVALAEVGDDAVRASRQRR
jgi:hypothetical protein